MEPVLLSPAPCPLFVYVVIGSSEPVHLWTRSVVVRHGQGGVFQYLVSVRHAHSELQRHGIMTV